MIAKLQVSEIDELKRHQSVLTDCERYRLSIRDVEVEELNIVERNILIREQLHRHKCDIIFDFDKLSDEKKDKIAQNAKQKGIFIKYVDMEHGNKKNKMKSSTAKSANAIIMSKVSSLRADNAASYKQALAAAHNIVSGVRKSVEIEALNSNEDVSLALDSVMTEYDAIALIDYKEEREETRLEKIAKAPVIYGMQEGVYEINGNLVVFKKSEYQKALERRQFELRM